MDSDSRFLRAFLKENKDIRIIKADKSKQLVVMNCAQYREKMDILVGDRENYRIMRENPGVDLSNK